MNQRALRLMVQRLGHEVEIVSDGVEAMARLEQRSFDLVLTDVEMPNMGGIELSQRIRHRECTRGLPRVPIIGTTAHVGADETHQLLAAGMDGHLPKPFTLSQLSDAIERTMPWR
mgnify:FL=1